MTDDRIPFRTMAVCSAFVAALAVTACDRSPGAGAPMKPPPTSQADSTPGPQAANQADPQAQPADKQAADAASPATPAPAAPMAGAMRHDDDVINAQVNQALQSDDQLKGEKIAASSAKGLVTLSGSVSDASKREHAGQLVLAVNGVTGVANRITVQ